MNNVIKANEHINLVYCGKEELRDAVGFHSESPTVEELKYALILAETRGHDTVFVHYDNVVSMAEYKNRKADTYSEVMP